LRIDHGTVSNPFRFLCDDPLNSRLVDHEGNPTVLKTQNSNLGDNPKELVLGVTKRHSRFSASVSKLLNRKDRPSDPLPEPSPKPASKLVPPSVSQKKKSGTPLRSSEGMGKEVAACAELLRKMYALELETWGMSQDVGDASLAAAKRMEANILSDEIHHRVHRWRRLHVAWTAEERQYIDDICTAVDRRAARESLPEDLESGESS
jgi:hypothetical protein